MVIGRFVCGNAGMFDAQMRRLKGTQWKFSHLPAASQVTTPSVFDVEPVTIWMLTDVVGRKGAVAPPVELTDTTINCVTGVIKAQADAGDTVGAEVAKRARPQKFDEVGGEPGCDDGRMCVTDDSITGETSVVVSASGGEGMFDTAGGCEGSRAGTTVEHDGGGVHGAFAGACQA